MSLVLRNALEVVGLRGKSLCMQLAHDPLASALSRSEFTQKQVLASEASTHQSDAA